MTRRKRDRVRRAQRLIARRWRHSRDVRVWLEDTTPAEQLWTAAAMRSYRRARGAP